MGRSGKFASGFGREIRGPTIARLESVEGELGGRELATEKIRAAMEIAGIAFNEFNGGGAGVRLGESCC